MHLQASDRRFMADPTTILSLELWARIFVRLESDLHTEQHGTYPNATVQVFFHQLPLVCRTFKLVFDAHPRLGQDICLRKRWKYPECKLSSSLVKLELAAYELLS